MILFYNAGLASVIFLVIFLLELKHKIKVTIGISHEKNYDVDMPNFLGALKFHSVGGGICLRIIFSALKKAFTRLRLGFSKALLSNCLTLYLFYDMLGLMRTYFDIALLILFSLVIPLISRLCKISKFILKRLEIVFCTEPNIELRVFNLGSTDSIKDNLESIDLVSLMNEITIIILSLGLKSLLIQLFAPCMSFFVPIKQKSITCDCRCRSCLLLKNRALSLYDVFRKLLNKFYLDYSNKGYRNISPPSNFALQQLALSEKICCLLDLIDSINDHNTVIYIVIKNTQTNEFEYYRIYSNLNADPCDSGYEDRAILYSSTVNQSEMENINHLELHWQHLTTISTCATKEDLINIARAPIANNRINIEVQPRYKESTEFEIEDVI